MIKNIELKLIEADFLRSQITQQLSFQTGEPPKFTSYLNGYTRLNEEIKKSLIEDEEFTSENLLRKLLLESITNEAVTFRSGFLDACYRYITDGKYNRATYLSKDKDQEIAVKHLRKHRLKLAAIGSAFLLVGIAAAFYYLSTKAPEPFVEDFNDLDVEHLNKKGWTIWHYNDSLWTNQIKPGHLTQWTTVGDNWVQTLKPHIDNFMYRKPNCDCFEVIVKVDSFRPTARWQQFNLVFFENPDRMDEFLRFGHGFDANSTKDTNYASTALIEIKNHIPYLLGDKNSLRESNNLTPLWLRVLVRHRKYSFSFRYGHEGAAFLDAFSFTDRPFLTLPKYVGIATMQAYKSDWKEVVSPIIPVFYDTFIINPIACE